MMELKEFYGMPQDAKDIRLQVFVLEQGFEDEFDDIDPFSSHLVLYEEGKPIGCCRYFWDETKQSYLIGRVALLPEKRRQNLGSYLLREAEQRLKKKNAEKIMLAAQVQAKDFYARNGYRQIGKIFYEEFCPHIWMEKDLNTTS
jgi:predicted GNAT family N-acyltransferase